MGDYIRPQVREMAAQLRTACVAHNADVVKHTASEVEQWLGDSAAGSMEVGFWLGVMRFCARQHPDPLISDYLLRQSDRLDHQRSERLRYTSRMEWH